MTETATVENTVAQELAAWPERLRSGDFEQTTGYLKDCAGYCCIGVLNETVLGASWIADEEEDYFVDQHGRIATISDDEEQKVGLHKQITDEEIQFLSDYFEDIPLEEDVDFTSGEEDRQSVLTALNDRGATFEQLAEVIEHLNWNRIGE